jgi:hypothetical protein
MVLGATRRTGSRAQNVHSPFADLLRQSVDTRLAVYAEGNNVERICHHPTSRLVGSKNESGVEEQLWPPNCEKSRRRCWLGGGFEGLDAPQLSIARQGGRKGKDSTYRAVLDIGSTEIPAYGEPQQGA